MKFVVKFFKYLCFYLFDFFGFILRVITYSTYASFGCVVFYFVNFCLKGMCLCV